ncbi:MAG: VWA domain-containing protein [Holophagaceae bacterium]|nr:VWA domain-containing protein [Holophagaceae bacterium]
MNLPFTYPVFLWPTAGVALLCLCAGLWAQGRAGLGVRVVGQRPWALGLGLALILGGLGLGIAEPRWGVPESPRLTVHIVLDASRSMLAVDENGGSRWNGALRTIDRILSKPSPGLRFSVDLLTGDAVPLMPSGEDRSLLRDALRAVKPGEIGSPGTSFGRGVPQILKGLPEKEPSILFVLSDGEESWLAEGDALQRASSSLKEAGVPLYAIAFGQGSSIPITGAAPDDPREKPEMFATTANPDFPAPLGGSQWRPDAQCG